MVPKAGEEKQISYVVWAELLWSERRDLNPRPHGPEPCALNQAAPLSEHFVLGSQRGARSCAPLQNYIEIGRVCNA